ncbi:MAG TPA: circadian clock protein KaiB [Desulfobacteraceae bacterium]|nr:circadian clock protein KaiB [Desulfobacteraceae bacterium]|tara:strand:+ start:536 stop:814 length:279 start_codon:yes stop_codon:yes gene_type:complete
METRGIEYDLCLFVAGDEPNSSLAKKNITAIFNDCLGGAGRLTIVDVFEEYRSAIEQNIVLTPTLVVAKPVRIRLLGTLSDRDAVLSALGVI